jgi:hypothetical protein
MSLEAKAANTSWLEHLPTWASVAVGGYAVVGLFGLTYLIVKLLPHPPNQNTALIIAASVAAPLALGFVWARLVKVKMFGVEVSLSQVTVHVDQQITVITPQQQLWTGDEQIIAKLRTALLEPGIKLIELNLRREPYWWSTRMFLVAALVDDYIEVDQFVLVEGNTDCKYIGMITPGSLRKSLAAVFPDLEVVYQTIQRAMPISSERGEKIAKTVQDWSLGIFNNNGTKCSEIDAKQLVTKKLLASWLRGFVDPEYLRWDGGPGSALLQYQLVAQKSPYVPLVREGRLEKIVDRNDLALRIARAALSQQLS